MLLCLFGTAAVTKAQNVVAPPLPTYSTTPPAVQAQLDEAAGVSPEEGRGPAAPDWANLLQWGPVTLHPHATYQFIYGTGLQSAPGQPQSSVVQTVSPGVLFDLGTHWTLDYTPSLTYYSNDQFHNTLNQSASLNWGTTYEDWNFSLSQGFADSDSPNVQTGTQISTTSYSTSLGASHALNSVMSLDMGVTQSFTDASQFNSSKSWNTMEWLNYQFFPRLDGAIGVGGGYDLVSVGSDMTHETVQTRVSWRLATKTSFVVHGGVEDRQFLGGGIPDVINPIYGAAIQYQPFEQTLISLNADRAVTTSFFIDQATEVTSLSVSLNQRLLKHFNFNIGGSYNTTDYIASAASVASGRSDRYYSINTSLSWLFLKRASASLTYLYSVNNSTAAGFTFDSSQYGFQLGYAF